MKRFGPGDITLHSTPVHSTVKIQRDDDYLTIVNFESGSENEQSQSYYRSLNHLFYDTQYHASHSIGTLYGSDSSSFSSSQPQKTKKDINKSNNFFIITPLIQNNIQTQYQSFYILL